MCVIIIKPENMSLSEKNLSLAWSANKDGAGIIVPQKNPRIVKGIMNEEDLKKILQPLHNQLVVIHLRFATHGSVSPENTHPFKAGDRRWLMHNGVLSAYGEQGIKGCSDSAHLASDISPLPNPAIRRILNSFHGKFVFVDRSTISIHGSFEEKYGCLWSNLNWNRKPINTYYGSNYKKDKVYSHFKSLEAPKRNTEFPKSEKWDFTKTQEERIQDLIDEVDPSLLLRSKYEHMTGED